MKNFYKMAASILDNYKMFFNIGMIAWRGACVVGNKNLTFYLRPIFDIRILSRVLEYKKILKKKKLYVSSRSLITIIIRSQNSSFKRSNKIMDE